MTQSVEMDLQERAVGVYPPSFCDWRLLLAVMVITEVSVVLVGLGLGGLPGWQWLALASLYAQWMALFCASGLCVMRGWTVRFSARGAWVASWVIALLMSVAFSFACWRMTSITMPQLIGDHAGMFVLKSAFAVGLVAIVFFRYLEIRARWRFELMAQAEARVQALQARIRPHFLFNSLNTIASLIPENPTSAEAATLDLADIFRGSMRRADQLISLSDELQLARQYLEMEKRRLGDRLEIDWRVAELPPGAAVLPLTLQPLLENAVAHGVQTLEDGGRICVYGRAEGDLIVVTISNPLAPEELDTSGHGMAMRNIRERLSLAFGARASLLTSQDAEQFFAVLSLPYVEYSDH